MFFTKLEEVNNTKNHGLTVRQAANNSFSYPALFSDYSIPSFQTR